MKVNPLSLLRKELLQVQSYNPSPPLEQISREIDIPIEKIVKLDTGENPSIEKILAKSMLKTIQLSAYPDPLCITLREKIAEYVGYPKEWIFCGNGSDEIIEFLVRSFAQKGEEIMIAPPTFPMYTFSAELYGIKVKQILRKKDFSIDISSMIKNITKKTKIVFIDSPGNPTGAITSNEDIKKLLAKNVIVVADEAYFEYCNQTVLPLVKQYPNLIVLRTFSKWAGLAGLRVGYTIGSPKIITVFLNVKQPYNVNAIAQIMAAYALDNKEKILKKLQTIINGRDKIIRALSRIKSIIVYPTQGAYIVFTPKTDAKVLQQYLKKNGVLVRIINYPLLENSIRINLAQPKIMKKVVSLIRRYYENR